MLLIVQCGCGVDCVVWMWCGLSSMDVVMVFVVQCGCGSDCLATVQCGLYSVDVVLIVKCIYVYCALWAWC